MLRHFLPFCTSRRKTPTTFTPWTGKIPPASSTTPPAAPAPAPKDTTPPSPPWAPKPASRPDGPPPVKTEEILSDTQKPLISLHGIRGFIFYVLSIQSTPSTLSEGISTAVLFSPPIIYRSFSKSSLAPAAIRRNQPIQQSKSHKSSLRPHVWGFFFTVHNQLTKREIPCRFRPHAWGFFFHLIFFGMVMGMIMLFSSPCLGILFSPRRCHHVHRQGWYVFVPMFGDPFFTRQVLRATSNGQFRFSSPCLGILFSRSPP